MRQQAFVHGHRAGARAATAVGRGEGLVQVHVQHVEAHVARPRPAEDGVQIRAVVVEQSAGVVNDVRDLQYPTLEDAAGRGIGEHDAGGARPDDLLERRNVDIAVCAHGNFAHGVAAHGGGRGIGAVGCGRHDDLGSLPFAVRLVASADHGHAGELALGTGHGRERHACHAGDGAEHLLQIVEAGKKALAQRHRRQRMPIQEAKLAGRPMRTARVVLHRAGTQRIELRVDGEVPGREVGVVPHHLQFGCLRQPRGRLAQAALRQIVDVAGRRMLGLGAAPRRADVVDCRRVLHRGSSTEDQRPSTVASASRNRAMSASVRFSVAHTNKQWANSGK